MTSIRFIINPISGRHPNAGRTISSLKRGLEKAVGFDCSFVVSERAGDMRALAMEAVREGVDIIVAVGGDGSVNEVAGAMIGSSSALGIIPKGSGNGLARHLGISMRQDYALRTILDGRTVRMDSGIMNGSPFFCTMGVGFDAKVGMDYALSGHRGLVTYAENALKDWRSYKPLYYSFDIDGQRYRLSAALLTIANANQWGNGFHIAPNASVADGLFDITVVKSLKSPHTLEMPGQILGYSIDRNSQIRTYRGREIHVSCESPSFYHLDGEPFAWDGKTLEVEIKASSLNVVIPKGKKRF